MNTITLESNNYLTILGATKVVSSTPTQTAIEQGETLILITGNELEIKKLDLDNKEVSLAGQITNLKFSTKAEKIPLVKRIFK